MVMQMYNWKEILLSLVLCFHIAEPQCTFPTALTGTWVSTNDGTWVITSSQLSGYDVIGVAVGVTTLNFTCYQKSGTLYALESVEQPVIFSEPRRLYTCVDLRQLSSVKYIYYQATAADTNGNQFTLATAYADICNMVSYEQPYNYHIALLNGSETSALQNCPSIMFGSYRYDTCTDPTATSMDVCDTRQQLVYNYTACNTPQMFSLFGVLDCVHHEVSDSVYYITLYNRDSTTPDNVNYYRYTCVAATQSGTIVYATANPEKCNDNQAPTTIASPGETIQFTSYYLCPITTTTISTTTTTAAASATVSPIIIGIVIGALLLLAIIAALIVWCCIRKRKKRKVDEEQPIVDKEGEKEEEKKSDEPGKDDHDQEERRSLDSGISEPASPTGTNDKLEVADNLQEEVIITTVGDIDVDVKNARPHSGQSRMSDLPPSTTPTGDTQTDEPQKQDQHVDETKQEIEDGKDDITANDDTTKEDDGAKDNTDVSKDDDDGGETDVATVVIAKTNEENAKDGDVNEDSKDNVKDDDDKNDTTDKENSDTDEHDTAEKPKDKSSTTKYDIVEQKEDEIHKDDKQKEKEDERTKTPTKEQEDHEKPHYKEEDVVQPRRTNDDGDYSEETRDFRKIGGRKDNDFVPDGSLTTVLVSREDDERKRMRLEKTSKKQRMRKLAKRKTKKGEAGDTDEGGYTSDEYNPDIHGNLADAPYMEQYYYKKRIERKLDGEHYWSDPEEYRKSVFQEENMNSKYGSRYSMDDTMDYDDSNEEVLLDERGAPVLDEHGDTIRIRKHGHKSKHKKGIRRDGTKTDGKGVTIKDGVTRSGSAGIIKSHGGKNDGTSDSELEKRRRRDMELLRTDRDYMDMDRTQSGNRKKRQANVIHVKEHTGDSDGQVIDDDADGKRRKRRLRKCQNGNVDYSDYDDSDMDKVSDVDSGVDEDDEVLDVVLTPEQQKMLVSSLFDKDMNLRPEFDRDENGRIVRRLDGSVIYDPATGRFTLQRRQGRVFNMPRLKRNKKGKPTGGYVEDEYGPKTLEDERKSAGSRRSAMSRGSALSYRRTPSDMRKLKGDSRNVGFMTPDDDMGDEFHKRGGRDMASVFRSKLRNRLFRKKKKRGATETPDNLPDVQRKKAWNGDRIGPDNGVDDFFYHDGVLNPIASRRGKLVYGWMGSPHSQRRTPGNSEQLQTFRKGLEKDRQILESIQVRDNSQENRFEPRDAFMQLDGESSTDPQYNENTAPQPAPSLNRSKTHWDGAGKFIVREKGCPDMQPKQQKLFKIVRHPGDMERDEMNQNGTDHSHYNGAPKTAPMMLESYDQSSDGQRTNRSSDRSPRSADEETLGSIDNSKLRRLLEELYKDKQYLDNYISTTEPKSDAVLHSKGLAEHGREYLLERADYWDKRGPLPPRPPMTEVGLKMQRQRTLWDTSRTTDQDSLMTRTPEPEAQNLPGVIESPRENSDNGHVSIRSRNGENNDHSNDSEHGSIYSDGNRKPKKNESVV